MPVYHVELRHAESKWKLWFGTVLADTEEEAVAEAKKFVAYADQIPFVSAVTEVAAVAKKAAEVAEEVAPATKPVDDVVEEVATEVEAVKADPGKSVKELIAELLTKL